MPFQHHPRQMFPHRARAARQPVAAARDGRVPRKDFTDRLGLPESATNAQVLAAVDKVVAPRQQSPAASLAEKAWGTAPASANAEQSDLYRKAWG